jgi:hypothetical protein
MEEQRTGRTSLMTGLVRYEAARAALRAAHDVDEVKEIRDKAQAMAAYAKQAKDTALVEWATEIKVRAERRAGQMLAEMRVNGSPAGRGRPSEEDKSSTLEDLGVTEHQSYRDVAKLSPPHARAVLRAAVSAVLSTYKPK